MADLREMAKELEQKRAKAKEMGGAERVKKQRDRGKLTCRERVDLLFEPGTFLEIGIHATHSAISPVMAGKVTPADGVITGYGKINGRNVGVVAYDFTVLGGSIGAVGETKHARLRDMVLKHRMPIVWLIDSAGARIHEMAGHPAAFAGAGDLFREQVIMSGVVPQVCAMVGPGAAGTAYIPGLADFVPMVKGTSSMALGGPPLVKAATGEDVTEDELGGSKIHTEVSGVADLQVSNDEECIEVIKEYLSYFPSHCEEQPPIVQTDDDPNRADEEILDIVPESPRKPYNMYKLIERVVDNGKYFDMKPRWARNLVTCFARMGGRPVGIVANQPMYLGGMLDVNSADKAARFINLCNAFNIPLVFLQDVPGFMVGSKVEKEGIIRHGAKMLYAVSNATVPKITIVVRKAYGAGYFVMCGRAYEPDYIAAWPTAEISVMGPEGMANILARRELKSEEEKEQITQKVRKMIDPYGSAGGAWIDDVIDPRETRSAICRALELSAGKKIDRPWKKHGVVPV